MKKLLFTLISFIFGFLYSNAQDNSICENMKPFCIGTIFTADLNSSVVNPGNNYDCLSSQPNPSWYFLKCATSGQIYMNLWAPSDIDFIIYGPFIDLSETVNTCGNFGVTSPVIDCSYSATNNETPSILSAQAGFYYVLLVTNYANQVQDITLTQTGVAH